MTIQNANILSELNWLRFIWRIRKNLWSRLKNSPRNIPSQDKCKNWRHHIFVTSSKNLKKIKSENFYFHRIEPPFLNWFYSSQGIADDLTAVRVSLIITAIWNSINSSVRGPYHICLFSIQKKTDRKNWFPARSVDPCSRPYMLYCALDFFKFRPGNIKANIVQNLDFLLF